MTPITIAGETFPEGMLVNVTGSVFGKKFGMLLNCTALAHWRTRASALHRTALRCTEACIAQQPELRLKNL